MDCYGNLFTKLIAFKHCTIPAPRNLCRKQETMLLLPGRRWTKGKQVSRELSESPLKGFEESEQASLRTDSFSYPAIQTETTFLGSVRCILTVFCKMFIVFLCAVGVLSMCRIWPVIIALTGMLRFLYLLNIVQTSTLHGLSYLIPYKSFHRVAILLPSVDEETKV